VPHSWFAGCGARRSEPDGDAFPGLEVFVAGMARELDALRLSKGSVGAARQNL
jgi:hypothetical protein